MSPVWWDSNHGNWRPHRGMTDVGRFAATRGLPLRGGGSSVRKQSGGPKCMSTLPLRFTTCLMASFLRWRWQRKGNRLLGIGSWTRRKFALPRHSARLVVEQPLATTTCVDHRCARVSHAQGETVVGDVLREDSYDTGVTGGVVGGPVSTDDSRYGVEWSGTSCGFGVRPGSVRCEHQGSGRRLGESMIRTLGHQHRDSGKDEPVTSRTLAFAEQAVKVVKSASCLASAAWSSERHPP